MKTKLGQLQTRASFQASSFNEEAGTVEVTWTTGARGKRSSWFSDPYFEELEVSERAVDMSRLNNGAPLLDAHSSYGVGSVIGVIERAWISDGEGRALVRFSDRAEVKPIKADVKAGILRHVSVGYSVQKYEKVGEEDDLKVYRATRWTPAEISLVPMGFDDRAVVRSVAGEAVFEVEIVDEVQTRGSAPQIEVKQMADEKKENPAPAQVTAQVDEAAVTKAERARSAEIRKMARIAKLDDKVTDDLIDRGVTVEDASKTIFAELEKRDQAVRTDNHVRVEVGQDIGRESLRAGAEEMLLNRVAPNKFKLTDNGRRFRGLRALELARKFIDATGRKSEGMSPMDIATEAMNLNQRGGMHSTSDFPYVLADVANKTLRRMYDEAPATYQAIARRAQNLRDFKPVYRTQLGEAPALSAIGEGGEFKRGTIGEGRESYQLSTYGKIVGFSRKALINDDLSAFDRTIALFGRSVRDLESNLVWAQITGNPTMGDGNTLFHTANHGNLAGSGATISVTSVGLGRKAMRTQKGLDGVQFINVSPAYLVVPAAQETLADQFVSTAMLAITDTTKNPFAGRLQVVAEPRLDASSTTAWYLFADPGAIDTVEYAYLEGEEGPTVETRMGFDVDGMEIKCRHDFAAKVIDWRGIYKNPGA